jgi:ribosomal-protein-alanine N-acetyltransferase
VDVALRPYAPEDFETLYRIDQACYPPGIAYSRGELRWYLRLPGGDSLVAELGKEIIGFIISEEDEADAHIITLDVLDAHRRRGIGSALLGELEKRLAARGVLHVELETATDNHPAVAFWQKHGYRTVGVLKRYYLGRVDAFRMIKLLARNAAEAASAFRET